MNWNQIEGNWEQFKGKAQTQWGKLTGDDLDVIAGLFQADDILVVVARRFGNFGLERGGRHRRQNRYGPRREKAER